MTLIEKASAVAVAFQNDESVLEELKHYAEIFKPIFEGIKGNIDSAEIVFLAGKSELCFLCWFEELSNQV